MTKHEPDAEPLLGNMALELFMHHEHVRAGRQWLGRLWLVWRPWPWRRTIATLLRGRGWHRGEWVDPNPRRRFRGTADYWREGNQ